MGKEKEEGWGRRGHKKGRKRGERGRRGEGAGSDYFLPL